MRNDYRLAPLVNAPPGQEGRFRCACQSRGPNGKWRGPATTSSPKHGDRPSAGFRACDGGTAPSLAFAGLLFVAFAALACSWVPSVAADDALTNDDVVLLVEAGLEDSVIIAKIQSSTTAFDTSVAALVTLANKGVPNDVVAAMLGPGKPMAEVGAMAPHEADASVARLSIGDVFRDPLGQFGAGPEMVVIPAGRFEMGCVENDGNCASDQMPPHEVVIAYDFAMSVHEVTFSDWDACVSAGGCGGYQPKDRWGRGNQPVNYVSWQDAMSYVSWLSGDTGREYRLPSEAEWEYATRARSSQHYTWGNGVGQGRANCRGCGSAYDDDATAPVGLFPANDFGLHDVHGNLWEWVADCWNDGYHNAPFDGSAWTWGDCSKRILRGGAWSSNPLTLRSAYRASDEADGRGSGRGFRVARAIR